MISALIHLFEALKRYVSKISQTVTRLIWPHHHKLVICSQLVSQHNHVKFLFLLKGVALLDHIEYNIIQNAKLDITALREVQGKFEKLQTCIDLPPGNYANARTQPSFDIISGIFTIDIKDFDP